MEVYSRPSDSSPSDSRLRAFYYDGFGRTKGDRYMIITDKCENKNSQRECSAMANGETSRNSSTRKLAGFLMLFYCSQLLSISKLFYNGKNLQAEKFIFYY